MRMIIFSISVILMNVQCSNQPIGTNPNVVFILADDLGYYDLSITGSSYYETPNIDQIAEKSIQFSQGYATCQVCSPSRASIMTGKYPVRLGITDWIGAKTGEDWRTANRFDKLLPAENNTQLDLNEITIAESFKTNGYKTFFAGKWHLGGEGSHPEDHGFDINKGGWSVGSPHGGFFSPWKNPKLENKVPGENLSIRLAKETAEFIQNHKDTSFFAFLSFYAVHAPLQTTEALWKKYRDKAEAAGINETGFEMERVLPIRRVQDHPVYAGVLESMDDAIGLVLDAVEQSGLAENTIIVFTSDNGGVASGDAYATSNLPLRGGKGYQWEGGIREPYFILVPGEESRVVNTPVTGTDFYPTLLELAGLPTIPEQHMDGISLVPLINGQQIPDRPLFWHYPHYGNQGGEPSSIIRKDHWKLIKYWEDERLELYDLSEDPSEKNNIAGSNKEILNQLTTKLESWLENTNARIPSPDPEFNEIKHNARHQMISTEWWQNREKQRLEFLSKDFNPKNNWWDSDLSSEND